MKKRFLSTLLALCMVLALLPGTASAATSGTCGANVTWTFSDGVLTIFGSGPMYNYENGTSPWFKSVSSASIVQIRVESGVTSIGNSAFRHLLYTESVTLPDTITSIGEYAFLNCRTLTEIKIPNNVTNIGEGAFCGCHSLSSITIPSGVRSIQYETFQFCYALQSVIIPNNVTSIERFAFTGCYALTSVAIPDSVTNIGEGAFSDCSALANVTIPGSVTSIGDAAFLRCTSLFSITIPKGASVGDGAFSGCTSLSSITLSDGVSMGEYVFQECTSLSSITILDGVTSIGARAFENCTGLEQIAIPESVTYIGRGAFYACISLSSISLSDGVTNIGDRAFYKCTNLEQITIPESVTSIGNDAFYDCPNLSIHCYKNSTAHQYAKENNIPFVLLDGDEPEATIHSVTLTRDGVTSDLLTQTAEFEHGLTENAAVSVGMDWDGGETGRVFLIQSKERYIELPSDGQSAAITPGTAFSPDEPVYAIATNANADELLDWKLTKLQVTEPASPSDDVTVALSLWSDKSCTNEIIAMTNTYGSFSWTQTGSNFDTAYLRIDYTGTDAALITLTAPDGFSFAPDTMKSTWTASVSQASGAGVCPVYPIYLENYPKGNVLEFTAEIFLPDPGRDSAQATLAVPVERNSGEGQIYYRDSFTEKQTGPFTVKDFSMWGFTKASTQYDQDLAMLSAYFSAAVYNKDGVERTLQNFGFSKIAPFNYNPLDDQVTLNQNQVACAFATKKYIVNGEVYTIVAVVIRGTVQNEWYSNFDIGSGAFHQGFTNAKGYVFSLFQTYMAALQEAGLTAEHTKLLITGHSRAAAVADLLAVDLNTLYRDQYAAHDDMYTYTFATPNSMASINGNHTNIYNIMNYQDIVAHVPGTFYSPGKNLYVNYPGSADYESARDAFQGYFDELVTMRSLHNPLVKYYDWGADALDVIAESERMDATALINRYGPGMADIALNKVNINVVELCLKLLLEASKIGASTGEDFGKAAGEIAGAPGKVIGGALGAVIGRRIGLSLGLVAEVTAYQMRDYCNERIISNHAIETYICWMNAISDGKAHFTDLKGAQVKIMCPVDVTVYDENHQIVSQIINNTVVQSTGPYCGIEGEEKIFYLANSDYTFDITGYDNGSMDIEITEYDEDGQKTTFINYADIPVEQDKTVSLTANNCGEENSHYSLVTDGDEVEPDHTASGADIGAVQVSVSIEGNGYVIGGGNYTAGERVTLYAVTDNSTFNGWYLNNVLVSSEATYQFSAKEATHITAKFTNNSSTESPSGGNTSGDGSSSGNPSGGTSSGDNTSSGDSSSGNPAGDGSPGGSPSYPAPSTYTITIPTATNGTVTASPKTAEQGKTVTLTVTPDKGYELDTLTVTNRNGKEIKLTDKGSGKYTFTMPNGKVTVDAVFDKAWSNPFTDVAQDAWYYDAVKFANKNGLMDGAGNGLFAPDTHLSRAQLAQILYNKEGKPAVTGSSVFTDVASDQWYTPVITWAAANGIVGGYGNGLFGPNDDITREQLTVMLWRYAGKPAATNKELHFIDAEEASSYAMDALRWAVENGIINGKGNGILDPKGLATRAQVAQMLKNFLEK